MNADLPVTAALPVNAEVSTPLHGLPDPFAPDPDATDLMFHKCKSEFVGVPEKSLKDFFVHKPDFMLRAEFFDEPALCVLSRYCHAVQVHHKDFEIQKYVRESKYQADTFQLRVEAPAHWGFKKCTGTSIGCNNSFVDWEKAAVELVKELKTMHCWAKVAYP